MKRGDIYNILGVLYHYKTVSRGDLLDGISDLGNRVKLAERDSCNLSSQVGEQLSLFEWRDLRYEQKLNEEFIDRARKEIEGPVPLSPGDYLKGYSRSSPQGKKIIEAAKKIFS